jgi:hypothetical protein
VFSFFLCRYLLTHKITPSTFWFRKGTRPKHKKWFFLSKNDISKKVRFLNFRRKRIPTQILSIFVIMCYNPFIYMIVIHTRLILHPLTMPTISMHQKCKWHKETRSLPRCTPTHTLISYAYTQERAKNSATMSMYI